MEKISAVLLIIGICLVLVLMVTQPQDNKIIGKQYSIQTPPYEGQSPGTIIEYQGDKWVWYSEKWIKIDSSGRVIE